MADRLLTQEFLKKLEQLSLASHRPLDPGTTGEHRSKGHGSSLEFADYRNYAPGDDFKRIDWQAYARLGSLFLKLTEGNEQLSVHILLDHSKSMNWGDPNKLQYAKRLAAGLGFVALSHTDLVTVTSFADKPDRTLPGIQGRNQVGTLLTFLEAVNSSGRTQYGKSLAEFCSLSLRRGLVVLVSDLMPGSEWQDGVRHLAGAHKEVIILHVLAPQELEPEATGDARLVDTETGTPLDVSINNAVIEAYHDRLSTWLEQVRTFCSRRRIDYVQVNTSVPLERTLLSYLEERRRR